MSEPIKRTRSLILRGWIFWLAFVVVASLTYNWLNSRGGVWTAWTYTTATKTDRTLIGAFETLEACRAAAQSDLDRRGARNGSFECGRKCELRRQGHYYCAETRVSPASDRR